MDKHDEAPDIDDEDNVQASLDGLADLATRMSHPSAAMEIIGIAAPEDAETLEQRISDSSILPLPNKTPDN